MAQWLGPVCTPPEAAAFVNLLLQVRGHTTCQSSAAEELPLCEFLVACLGENADRYFPNVDAMLK